MRLKLILKHPYKNEEGVEISEEIYKFPLPHICVGNIMVPGKQYTEPYGKIEIQCEQSGASSEIEYMARGWTSNWYTNRIEAKVAEISDPKKEHFKLEGYYLGEIKATDVATNESFTIFKAPEYLNDRFTYFGMSHFALRLNMITDELKKKLPPTDTRLRMDIRNWEEAKVNEANQEQTRLENNIAKRFKQAALR